MAVENTPIKEFADWYSRYTINERDGTLQFQVAQRGSDLWKTYDKYRSEMDARVANFDDLIKQANAEVVSEKPDLPNVSSGETAGMIRRMARNLVQHTPNVDLVSKHDTNSPAAVLVRQILTAKIIGDDEYSNDMQQNLFASAKNSLTLGFDCVIPILKQDAAGGWCMKYNNIFYRDVFPEPGAKDVRDATDVFVRRYLTKGEVVSLVRNQVSGWDIAALKTLLLNSPRNRRIESQDHESTKHHVMIPDGYEIITYYSNTGDPFLTFDEATKMLLRIEKNKHPLKQHPVFFLVMEKDLNQPLGKSQVELTFGRQEFQDLMLNGAMKLWYRNINPSIIGYGVVNSAINLSPGKYNAIANPNAKVEAFEVNTQSLLQFSQISATNAAGMVGLIGAADQTMATTQSGQMSNTPQGVNAQQAVVDITTNNYQKAIEQFFSRYCSYALTVYFAELKGSVAKIIPTADTRTALLNSGLGEENFDDTGALIDVEFDNLVTEYWVRTVPGSLIEMEDEKQLRILRELFVPLSQAMPALAQSGDPSAIQKASAAMMYIVEKTIELSGSEHSAVLEKLWKEGKTEDISADLAQTANLDDSISKISRHDDDLEKMVAQQAELQSQNSLLRQSLDAIMGHLGIPGATTEAEQPITSAPTMQPAA